jgi:hypothetical protein
MSLKLFEMECNVEQMDGVRLVRMTAETPEEAIRNYNAGEFVVFDDRLRVRDVNPDYGSLRQVLP